MRHRDFLRATGAMIPVTAVAPQSSPVHVRHDPACPDPFDPANGVRPGTLTLAAGDFPLAAFATHAIRRDRSYVAAWRRAGDLPWWATFTPRAGIPRLPFDMCEAACPLAVFDFVRGRTGPLDLVVLADFVGGPPGDHDSWFSAIKRRTQEEGAPVVLTLRHADGDVVETATHYADTVWQRSGS